MERWERLVKVRSRDILSTLPVNLSKEGINREHPRLPDSAVVIQHRTSRFRSSGDPFTFREAPPSDTGTLRTMYTYRCTNGASGLSGWQCTATGFLPSSHIGVVTF